MAGLLLSNTATDAKSRHTRHRDKFPILGICLGVTYSMALTVNTCECRD